MIDLAHWNLTIPVGEEIVIETKQLQSYQSPYFKNDGTRIVFWSPVVGKTTKNAKYPRSELRETKPNGDLYNWKYKDFNYNYLHATLAVNQIPSSKKVVIGQIHGGSTHPLLKLYYMDGNIRAMVRTSYSGKEKEAILLKNVPLNAIFKYDVVVTNKGVLMLTAEYNNVTNTASFQMDSTYDNDYQYFKAGMYVQDNQGYATEGGMATFYNLDIQHVNKKDEPAPTPDTNTNNDADTGSKDTTENTDKTAITSGWNLTLPDESASTIKNPELVKGYNNTFYTKTANKTTFWVPVTGGHQSGSNYARSELRESTVDGKSQNWTVGDGDHVLDAALVINQVPSNGKVTIGQIRNNTSGGTLVSLEYDANQETLFAIINTKLSGKATSMPLVKNMKLNKNIGYYFHINKAGTISVIGKLNGTNVRWDYKLGNEWKGQQLYFKAGAYLSDNEGKESEGAELTFSKLTVTHQ